MSDFSLSQNSFIPKDQGLKKTGNIASGASLGSQIGAIQSKANTEVKISKTQDSGFAGVALGAQIGAMQGKALSNISMFEKESTNFKKDFSDVFKKLDKDNNGFISKNELLKAMSDSSIKGKEASIVAILNTVYDDQIRDVSDDEFGPETNGISLKDIMLLDQDETYISKNKPLSINQAHKNAVQDLEQLNSLRKSDGTLTFPKNAKEINYQDLKQSSGIGDCYFLATLTSMAKNKPQELINMVKDNNNGTFTVKFNDKSVTIKSPSDSELAFYSKGKTWVPILEKAYAEYRNSKEFFPEKEITKSISGRTGFTMGKTITELTGNDYKRESLKEVSNKDLSNSLKGSLDKSKLIITSIVDKNNKLGLPANHAYSIIGFDEKTQKVLIKNPWGEAGEPKANDDKNPDGIFTISLAELKENFFQNFHEK